MKKTKWGIILFFLFPIFIFSQEKIITGKVTDDSGIPLIGVSVILKDSSKGAITDFDGRYMLSTGEIVKGVLEFSYLGYATEDILFDGKTNEVNVTLSESQEQLDEVVVTAFGVEREQKTLTYAAQKVDTESLTEAQTPNFLNGLAGKAAGVQIVNSSTPTGSTRVVIRGLTSITGDNQPLYIIDGIALDSQQGDGGVSVWNEGSDIDYGSPLSNINPNDIESLQVLKGANAAALYGSRASNGVILITTKKGASDKDGNAKISFNSNMSFVSNREYPDYQYAYGTGASGRISGSISNLDPATGLPVLASQPRAYGMPFLGQEVLGYNSEPAIYKPNYNNIKELYKVGTVYTNDIAISKGNEQGSFRFAFQNTRGDHVMQRMENQIRNNFTLRFSRKISSKLRTDVTAIYTNQKVNNRLYQNGSERNPANNYMYMRPDMSQENLVPYKDLNNQQFIFNGPFNNPYWNLYENSNRDETNSLVANVSLNWEIIKGLNLSGKVNGVVANRVDNQFNNMGANFDPDGLYRTSNSNRQNWNYEAILNYKKKIKEFNIVALAGVNRFDLRFSNSLAIINSLIVRDVKSLLNSADIPVLIENSDNKRVNSVFGSVTLGYKDTYFLDLTARNDWSSALPINNNSYFYPSVGGSVVFSDWIPRNEILTFGKIRASYAQVGNDTRSFRVLDAYNFGGNYNGIPLLALQQTKNNAELKPELTSSTEFGFETKLFKNKISLNATYYKSATNNQIIPVQVTPTSGFSSNIINAGEIENEGFEVFLSAKIFDNKFKWTADVNWSNNRSNVVSLIDGVERLQLRSWFNVGVFAEVGKPFGNIRGNVPATDPETGATLLLNNGRVRFNSDEYLGNAQADWIGNLRNSFSYKGLSFSFLIDVKMGGDLYSATMVKTINHGIHSESIPGREDWILSSVILNENNNERQGIGLFGNDYVDTDRPKGRKYDNAAIGVQDADGNWVAQRDADGNVIYQDIWLDPMQYGFDGLSDQPRFVYDASYVKLREVVLAYNIPMKKLQKVPFKSMKISVVGRDLWTIYRNTPQGIDPEAQTTSGNGQGIEYGSFLPTRTVGLNLKLDF
ncbi:MAG: SusC/RagA family TonB-linked outer membrane protein [Flavobacteriaceae bacterium]|nr:SusC/RagA family TonB-linked outer membrane protein [Flavobacteriaceae bacterium]